MSRKGKKLSKEHKEKISKALKGRIKTKEHLEKIRLKMIGRKVWNKGLDKYTDNRIKLLGEKSGNSRIGRKMSNEQKKKISKSLIGIKRSVETRIRIGKAKKGVNCYFWKGGITKPEKSLRQSLKFKLWRESVFKRDNYRCVSCGSEKELYPHHKKSFSKYPNIRFDIKNGETLCRLCHKKTDNYGIKAWK